MGNIFNYIKNNVREVLLIVFITLFALLLRVILIQNYGDLWLDELYSWYFAQQNSVIDTVVKLIKQDIHMPLYFIILHCWIKLFGASDLSMHSCTLFLTLPLIPVSFYIMKSLFGKMEGYFAVIMLTINSFCIYYSVEVRFYGFVFLLAILSAFYFAKMLETFDKKYFWGFIISHFLLIYTFSITGLLTLSYAITAGIYTYIFYKENFKKVAIYFCILLIVSIPAIVIMLFNTVAVKTAICSFQKDIYFFNWNVIIDILENFFSNETFQIITGNINNYRGLSNILNPNYFFFVFVPMLIGLFGFVKALFTKNKTLYLFLIPSLIFVIISLILASLNVMSFLTRYASIVYPIIVCASAFGLAKFKSKTVAVTTFLLFLILNYTYFWITPQTILLKSRMGLRNLPDMLNNVIKITDKDYVLIPYSGSKVMRYVPRGNFIDFEADDMLLLKDDKSYYFYIGGTAKAKRNIIKDYLYEYIRKNQILPYYEQNLLQYINRMEKGSRLILIEYRRSFTHPLIEDWQYLFDYETFSNTNMFIMSMSKVIYDSISMGELYLKPLNYYVDNKGDYAIYVYEKQ